MEGKKGISQLGNEAWIAGLESMIDITEHFLSLNCTLPGNIKFYKDSYSTASAFIKKLCHCIGLPYIPIFRLCPYHFERNLTKN